MRKMILAAGAICVATLVLSSPAVETLTLGEILKRHEHLLLGLDGVLIRGRESVVTNDMGRFVVEGNDTLAPGEYFCRFRDADGGIEICNAEGAIIRNLPPVREGAWRLLVDYFSLTPEDASRDCWQMSYLVTQWRVISAADASALHEPRIAAPRRFAASLRGVSADISPETHLCFTSVSPTALTLGYTLAWPTVWSFLNDRLDLFTSVDLLDRWTLHNCLDVMGVSAFTGAVVKAEVVGWHPGSSVSHTPDCALVTNIVESAIDPGETYTNIAWNCDHRGVPESPVFLRVADETDSDGDGLTDAEEKWCYDTGPYDPDTDGDGLNDGWEVRYGFEPCVSNANDSVLRRGPGDDWDEDGLSNAQEAILGTDPHETDTDGDGLSDGVEIPAFTLATAEYMLTRLIPSVNEGSPMPLLASPLPAVPSVIPTTLLNAFTNPNDPENSRYVTLGVCWGDPSTSISEKYAIELVCTAGSAAGSRETLVNATYGHLDLAPVFLRKGCRYALTLRHVGTKCPDGPDPDYALVLGADLSKMTISDPDELLGVADPDDGSFPMNGKTVYITALPDVKVALTVDGEKEGIVLKHAGYLNTLEDQHGPSETVAELKAINYVPFAGNMTLSAMDAASEHFVVYDNPELSGNPIELPYTWCVDGEEERTFYVQGISRSEYENDSRFRAEYAGSGVSDYSDVLMTMVEVRCCAEAEFPALKSRHIHGPLERLLVRLIPYVGRVTCASVGARDLVCEVADGGFVMTSPSSAGDYTLLLYGNGDGKGLKLDYSVVAPQAIEAVDSCPMDDDDWRRFGFSALENGVCGVGVALTLRVLPTTVSFSGISVFEGEVGTSGRWGVYLDYAGYPEESLYHGAAAGAVWAPWMMASDVSTSNIVANLDYAGSVLVAGNIRGLGGYQLEIPQYWYSSHANESWSFDNPSTQIVEQQTNGTMSVKKHGVEWERTIDGVYSKIK